MNAVRIAQATANLDAWLETMRQPRGFGGPVAHWWQSRFQFTGPGLDWRYEGVLTGYAELARKAPTDDRWRRRLDAAAADLMDGQQADGTYLASRFELNPGTLGTPHEAAATLGLISALPHLADPERALGTAKRNLDHLIDSLWDGDGFADQPNGTERVPNKLATLAHALIAFAQAAQQESYLRFARSCLDAVLRLQIVDGVHEGAIHQYAPDGARGDGRFFPYYNARCVRPLLLGASVLGDKRYGVAADRIVRFLERTMTADGTWRQIEYLGGRRAEWPRWVAGSADVLLALRDCDRTPPPNALERLLASQLQCGGFPTAVGFTWTVTQRARGQDRDLRDILPVVGWNDKVLRLLVSLLPDPCTVPTPAIGNVREGVGVYGVPATYVETTTRIDVVADDPSIAFSWDKASPWAKTCGHVVNRR